MSDELGGQVVERLIENQQAFLRFLEAKLGDRTLAEDVLQEAFVRGLGKASTVREGDSATAWFYRVLRNAVVDHARRRAASSRKLDAFAAELAQHEQPAEADTQGAVCKCVSRLAATLKPEYAEAVQCIEVEGMSVKQFAESVGISSNNAAVRVFRAREALREQVLRCCGACAKHGCLDCSCSHP